MANKKLFKQVTNTTGNMVATAVNAAGGTAYSLSDEAALAQLAVTGCLNSTFYASAEQQLDDVLQRAQRVRPEFLAKLAAYSRNRGFMKDTPALLLAVLMVRDPALFQNTFPLVVDNGKMLRNFIQIVRSGKVGRKSFGSAPKRLIRMWLSMRSDKQLLDDSVGNDPSLADIIKMVHPKPTTKSREVLYRYLIGKSVEDTSLLPEIVQELEAFKKASKGSRKVPNVSFQLLTALDLSDEEWKQVALNGKWHQTRMNLNTYARHNVLSDNDVVNKLASRLGSRDEVRNARVLPYQLYVAYQSTGATVPQKLRNALQDAMEVATENVPKFAGKVYVGVDYSGSMRAAVTGNRGTATSVVTCNQVGSLMAACVMRNSEDCTVYRFDTTAQKLTLNPRDSIMSLTQQIGSDGGGTDCSSVLRNLNKENAVGNTVIILSDTESWSNQNQYNAGNTGLMTEWAKFKKRNPAAKLVLIDLAANTTTQVAPTAPDVLHVGGFSDSVFEVVNAFLNNESQNNNNHEFWVNRIMEESLP